MLTIPVSIALPSAGGRGSRVHALEVRWGGLEEHRGLAGHDLSAANGAEDGLGKLLALHFHRIAGTANAELLENRESPGVLVYGRIERPIDDHHGSRLSAEPPTLATKLGALPDDGVAVQLPH